MAGPRPEDFGLSEGQIEEIRARDRRQAELFVYLVLRGVAVAFVWSLRCWPRSAP